jgi:hypothetical protein
MVQMDYGRDRRSRYALEIIAGMMARCDTQRRRSRKKQGYDLTAVPLVLFQSANRQMTTLCLALAEQAVNNELAILP